MELMNMVKARNSKDEAEALSHHFAGTKPKKKQKRHKYLSLRKPQ